MIRLGGMGTLGAVVDPVLHNNASSIAGGQLSPGDLEGSGTQWGQGHLRGSNRY